MTVRLIEGQVPYTGGTAIEITADKVINLLLRSEDNLLQVNQDNELYCDLQLANGIAPNDDFPVGVTTGIVNANDGRPYNGLLLHYETTSGAYAQWLYAGDGHFYLDGGTGTFKKVYYADEVDAIFQQLVDMIGDGTLTIQRNGTTVGTFTANQSTNTTVNITVPTALTDLTNDLVNDGKLTIKRNHTTLAEFTANDATNVYADISVPEVANNTSTTDSTMALSALMGKELQDQINNINMIGRFLSIWNCTTGLPSTNPQESPYTYHTGDYYIIGAVSNSTNYRPDGGTYTSGVPSTTVETATVNVGDMYFFDGQNWILKLFSGQTMPVDNVLSTTSTNPVENRVITNELLLKANLTDINTKAFFLSSTSDLTNAQAVYDYYAAGNNPIVIYGNQVFVLGTSDSTKLKFYGVTTSADTNSISNISNPLLQFALSSGTVQSVSYNSEVIAGILKTGVNYSTPYSPLYNGSPATKKYIDDKIISGSTAPANPTQGMVWYDTTNDILKTYDGTNWNILAENTDINTKTFPLSGYGQSAAVLAEAQDILDYYQAGNNPVVDTGNGATWIMIGDTGTKLTFYNGNISPFEIVHEGDPGVFGITWTNTHYTVWEIEYSGTTATLVSLTTYSNEEKIRPYLSTTVDYTIPYMPIYDGSPATKKYVDNKQISISVTLEAADWSSKSITVTATGVTSSNTVIIAPDPSSITDYADNSVYCSAQGTNTLTFSCDTEPTNDLTVNVVILN